MQSQQFIDRNNRVINYLRISVTDRCNLRCIYCVGEDFEYKPHKEILTYEEILHLARLFVAHGIRKIRVTGGEPLVRKDLIPFLEKLTRLQGLEEVSLTTNGILLEQFASALKQSGIHRLNVSMDTLQRERYARITGKDSFHQVWKGIRKARELGLEPIKLNVVAIKGLNDDEILDFARLAYEEPYHVRFIEFMPVGRDSRWSPDQLITVDLLKEEIESLWPLEPLQSGPIDGPARRFKPRGGKGEIGFIGAVSHHFCSSCNRLRMTAEGKLRTCLFSDREYDLKTPLRRNKGDRFLLKIMEEAVNRKPRGHNMNQHQAGQCARRMVRIGG